jgi:nicotinamide phosphoribosyltransferase
MFKQYPPNTTGVYSYIESRGGDFNQTLFFGLQGFIKEYLLNPITQAEIDEAEEILSLHGEPFNKDDWQYIVDSHKGKLPVIIKAIPEGTIVPTGNALVTIENTDPKCFWLTTWLETSLLRAIWYPTTVATQSWEIKQLIKSYLEKTGDVAGLPFKLHDFGARGVSSFESAGIGGAAHLVNFMGTDTISGILYAKKYYDAGVCGFSIPAAEHSTITSWGRENEAKAYKNMLQQFAKQGSIVAVVSDSYDVFNAAEEIWGKELKQDIIDSGATVVIRPDSGDPIAVNVKLIEVLNRAFGHTVNSKGYKLLNNVRIIQGDGVSPYVIKTLLNAFEQNGWSADNIAFGMGGALLQGVNRDTLKFAMKCSSVCVDGEWRDVMKDPITDSGKRSKAGRISLWRKGDSYETSVNKPTTWTNKGFEWKNAMKTVFENGELKNPISFEEIRGISNG